MSRYIDADEFLANESEAYMNAQIKLAKENADKTIDPDRYINLLVHNKLQMLIADTPTIDIVRCKECRFGQWHEQAEEYICIAHGQDLFDGDHFCSYGVKKGADDE